MSDRRFSSPDYSKKIKNEYLITESAELQPSPGSSQGQSYAVAPKLRQNQEVEQALRESEARFAGIFNSAAIGMALVSLEGDWLVVNPALCQMVGYSEAELQQTTSQAITYPEDLLNECPENIERASGE